MYILARLAAARNCTAARRESSLEYASFVSIIKYLHIIIHENKCPPNGF